MCDLFKNESRNQLMDGRHIKLNSRFWGGGGHYVGVHDKNPQLSSMSETLHEAEKTTPGLRFRMPVGKELQRGQTIRPTSCREG